jgi:hypothetical protein
MFTLTPLLEMALIWLGFGILAYMASDWMANLNVKKKMIGYGVWLPVYGMRVLAYFSGGVALAQFVMWYIVRD